jgi:hypothetical protein
MEGVTLFSGQVYLAFDASRVAAAMLGGGAGGRRVRSFASVPLAPRVVSPSASTRNIGGPDELRSALDEALGRVDGRSARAVLVLPHGVARLVALELSPGAEPRDFVRFRLAGSLPWPASEAIVDALPTGRGRVAGAAVRRDTVAEYEKAAASAGLEVDRVHLSPLLALEGLLRRGSRQGVHVLLGDVACSIVAFHLDALAVLRTLRRDRSQGEAGRLAVEAARTSAVAGSEASARPVALSGTDADRLAQELSPDMAAGSLRGPADWPEAVPATWLAGALA